MIAAGVILTVALFFTPALACACQDARTQQHKRQTQGWSEGLSPAVADEIQIFHTPYSDIGGQ